MIAIAPIEIDDLVMKSSCPFEGSDFREMVSLRILEDSDKFFRALW